MKDPERMPLAALLQLMGEIMPPIVLPADFGEVVPTERMGAAVGVCNFTSATNSQFQEAYRLLYTAYSNLGVHFCFDQQAIGIAPDLACQWSLPDTLSPATMRLQTEGEEALKELLAAKRKQAAAEKVDAEFEHSDPAAQARQMVTLLNARLRLINGRVAALSALGKLFLEACSCVDAFRAYHRLPLKHRHGTEHEKASHQAIVTWISSHKQIAEKVAKLST